MPSPGTRLGRYEVLARLGAGGMGEVFRARDGDLGRDVAIKVLPEPFAADPKRLARFTQEARAASALNHPNILTIHEIGEASGQPYIVMEYVDGQPLRRILGDRPLPPKRALDLAVQLADGLAKAHAAGIVHRDLKPENVMVTGDGVVKIVDFGLAKPTGALLQDAGVPASEVETRPAPPETANGAIVGTVGYMAPEQARGEKADHRADQFALGAILYEMATGRRAFRRDSAVQTLVDIIEHDPPPIETLNPVFPAQARWLIERCLAKDPGGRYASTQDLARELHTIREHLSEATSTAASLSRRTARMRRRLRPWQALLFAVIVVIGVVAAPLLRDLVTRWVSGTTLPDDRRIAVLPVTAQGDARPLSNGLLEYVVMRLADLNRFDRRISVVPASEVVESGVRNTSAARRRLGATIAVSITLNREGDDVRVNVSLEDTRQVRTLGGNATIVLGASYSPERVVDIVVRTLQVELAPEQQTAWEKGVPAVAEAAVRFAQGLTPYQQARTALQRYEQEDRLAQAIALFNQAIDLDPRYAAAYAGLGEAHLRLYRLTKNRDSIALAEKALQAAATYDDTRPGVWISLGMLHAETGHAAEAERAFQRAIAGNPAGADAYRELGYAYQQSGQPAKAEAAYRKAIDLQPGVWANHSYLGFFHYGQGRYTEAEKDFRQALTLAEDNVRLWSNLGGVYMAADRPEDAEKALKRALQIDPHYGPAVSNLAFSQFQHGRYAEAAATFKTATELWPRDADIWRNLGSARYFATRDLAEAAPAYQRAADLLEEARGVNPRNAHTLVGLADCYAMLRRHAEARALVAQAMTLKPASDDLRMAATVYEQVGDREAALRLVKAALAAGLPVWGIETNRSLDALRRDPRYAAIVKDAAGRSGAVKR